MDNAVIQCRQLTKQFGERKAVDSVSFELPRGAFLVVFGANGAGKTTLLRLLAAMTRPSAGEALVCGENTSENPERARAKIGYMGHESMLYPDLDALQNLCFYAQLFGVDKPEQRALELLRQVELAHRRYDSVRSFSKGMTQRLAIARALVNSPELLFLDEPYSGLDAHAAEMLDGIIARTREEKGTSCVMVSHDAQKGYELATHVLFLQRGGVAGFYQKSELDQEHFTELYQRVVESGVA